MSVRLLLDTEPGEDYPGPTGLPPGHVCFLDWGSGEGARWGRGYPERDAERRAAERRAAQEWAATAEAAAAQAASLAGGGPIAVLGMGALAALVRMALEGPATILAADQAVVVVDTTGSAACLDRALRRAAPRGIVLLAAPPTKPEADVRTYDDLHRRSLTVTAVRWTEKPPRSRQLTDWALRHLADADGPRTVAAPWHRIAGVGRVGA
ncbi:hypothetical protein [Streptomyces sp. NPDC053048]|uniref:hypothetical protein n=1 Tax=Streptomyces sp. NPDC053048 TaxID=3365694 RepID=UPI0037CD2E92